MLVHDGTTGDQGGVEGTAAMERGGVQGQGGGDAIVKGGVGVV